MGGCEAPGEWSERIGSLLIEIHGTEGRRQAGIDEMMGYLRNKGFTCRKHEAHWSAVWATRERAANPPALSVAPVVV